MLLCAAFIKQVIIDIDSLLSKLWKREGSIKDLPHDANLRFGDKLIANCRKAWFVFSVALYGLADYGNGMLPVSIDC